MKYRGLQHAIIFKVPEEEMRATISFCEICGIKEEASGKMFALDHDHATGQVRGLLCFHCNIGIGHLKDDIKLLQKAIEYLQRSV
jgi:hypothetical protein